MLNWHLPPMGSDLLGVHRITLIHYYLAPFYDSLVLFLPHPPLQKTLECLPNTQDKRRRNSVLPDKANAQPTSPIFPPLFSRFQLTLGTRRKQLLRRSERLKVRCGSSSQLTGNVKTANTPHSPHNRGPSKTSQDGLKNKENEGVWMFPETTSFIVSNEKKKKRWKALPYLPAQPRVGDIC